MDYMDAFLTWNHKEFIDLTEGVTRKNTPSQNGEGGLINEIFGRCKPKNKWCFEAGADNGYNLSNTWYLINKENWSAILCENNEKMFKELYERYKDNQKVHLTNETLRPNGLDEMLEKFNAPKDIDLISIDIDSYDDEVWMNLKKHRPNLVCIECDPFESDFSVVSHTPPMRDDGRVGGASVGLLNKIAKEKGYKFLCVQICSVFYIESEFAKPILI
jgi:hypothetical protein